LNRGVFDLFDSQGWDSLHDFKNPNRFYNTRHHTLAEFVNGYREKLGTK